ESFNEVCQQAKIVEEQLKRRKVSTRLFSKPYQNPRFAPSNRTTPQKNLTPKPTDKKPETIQRRPKCYKCQGLGHYAAECPTRAPITLAEYASVLMGGMEQEPVEDEALEGEGVEEIEELPDEGELLVLRKLLSTLPQAEEE